MTQTRVIAYLPNGASQGPVPAPQSLQLGVPLNDTGALMLAYPPQGPRGELLGQPLELAVEVSNDGGLTWAEPKGARFLYLRDGRDPVRDDAYQVEAAGYILRLSKALVPFTGLSAGGERVFTNATPGKIMGDLMTEAQGRGALSGLSWDFTATLDSGGTPWPQQVSLNFQPGTDLLAILNGLAEQGLVDYITNGRTVQVYVAEHVNGLGVDRTTGANPVSLRFGRDLTEAPFRRTWEALADTAFILGDNGSNLTRTNGAATKPWGRQETFVTAAGVSDSGTLQVIGDASLKGLADPRSEHTHGVDFTAAVFLPFRDYYPGNWVYRAVDGAVGVERMRVRQITLTRGADGVTTGNVVLNDRFQEADVRQARRIAKITGQIQGGAGGIPTPVGNDILAPAAVTSLSGSSEAYHVAGVPFAQVTLDWPDVTTNADGSAIADLDHYEVERRKGTSGNWEQFQTSTGSAATSSGYTPGEVWQFRVRAVDTVFNRGGLSPTFQVTTATDTTPPPVPSTPDATSFRGVVSVAWDGKDSTAQVMPEDLDYVEVHIGTPGFTPTPGPGSTLKGVLKGQGSVQVSALTVGNSYGAKLLAVDTSGNYSTASVQDTVVVDSPDAAPVAPTAAVTPTAQGGIRDIKVSWAPVTNPSPYKVELHLSTTAGFTPTPGATATLVKTSTGTFASLDKDAAGNDLMPGTVYYLRTITLNDAGSLAPSAQLAVSLRQVTSSDISVDAAWVGTMDVGRLSGGQLEADVVIGADMYAQGVQGEKVSLSGLGFQVTGPVVITRTVTTRALTSNVVTLTTSVAHGFLVDDVIDVKGVGAPFDGRKTILSVPTTTTFTYETTGSNVTSGAAPGGSTVTGRDHDPNAVGETFVRFPTDGTQPNIVAGQLKATTVSIAQGGEVNGELEVAPGATITLAATVSAPRQAPIAEPTWATLSLTGNPRSVIATRGLTKTLAGTNWLTVVSTDPVPGNNAPTAVWEYDAAGNFVAERKVWTVPATASLPSYQAYGIVRDPIRNVYHALVWNGYYAGDPYVVHTFDSAWAYLGESPVVMTDVRPLFPGGAGDTEYRPSLGWDFTNNKPLIGYHDYDNNKVTIDTWNVDATTKLLTTRATQWNTSETGYAHDLNYVARLTGDLPGERYQVSAKNFDLRCFPTTNNSARKTEEQWPSANALFMGGSWYDSTAGKWSSITADGMSVYHYETGSEFYWTTSASDTWRLGYTWYDSSGTIRETGLSPIADILHVKRARLQVTASSVPSSAEPDNPTGWRFYKSTGAGSTPVRRGNEIPKGTTTKVYVPGESTGVAAPTNNFPAVANPGQILGGAGVFIKGDGTAQLSKLVADSPDAASAAPGNKPALRVGPPTGKHLRVDGDGIFAMSNDSTQTMLNINPGGATRAAHGGGGTFQVGINGNIMTIFKGGSESLTSDGSGQVSFNHGMGTTPSVVVVTSRNNGSQRVFTVTQKTSSQIQIRVENSSGASVNNTSGLSFDWMAFA